MRIEKIPTVSARLLNEFVRGGFTPPPSDPDGKQLGFSIEFSGPLSTTAIDHLNVTIENIYTGSKEVLEFVETGNNTETFSEAQTVNTLEPAIVTLTDYPSGNPLPTQINAVFDSKNDEHGAMQLQLARDGSTSNFRTSPPPASTSGGFAGGGDPNPEIPEEAIFKVRLPLNPINAEDEFELHIWGETDDDDPDKSKKILGKATFTKQSDGRFLTKPILAIRDYDALDAAVFDELGDEYDLVEGDGSVVVIIGIAAVGAVAVNVGDYLKDEAFLGLVNWWDGKDANTRIFRVLDSGGLTVGASWDGPEQLAKSKGWTDSDENLFAERAEILDNLRDMDGDDIFVFHGHAAGILDTSNECDPVVSIEGLTGYDTFGFRDFISRQEIETFMDGVAPGVVVISGCASFKEPLKNTFRSKGTKLYVGWSHTTKNSISVAAVHILLERLLNGESISAAVNAANMVPALTTLNQFRQLQGCEPVRLKAEASGGTDQTLYKLLEIPDPNK